MIETSSPNGFVAPKPADLAPLFPAYEIHDLIAVGGMGAVYRAVQKSLDRTVALKILPMEFSEDAEFCAGFEAEAKAMARLNHPNLIGVYDFGEVNGMLFIVMEFVPGKSIYHSANGIAIDPGEVIRLITGVCNGLAHAHENGILHRDIKPSNILLTVNAEPKIGDFGLARPIEQKTQADEVIFGTPGYTAPEVINAPLSVDHRADLFSVGVLLHELLTGKLPADDLRPASVISRCDLRFDVIIRRATNPVPATRYSSAAEIAADLQKIIARPVTGPMAKVSGVPKTGVSGPPRPVRGKSAGVKRKSLNLTWVGPLVAIAIMAYSWHAFMDMKPKVVVIEDPAAKPTPPISSGRDTEEVEEPAEPETAPTPSPPPSEPPLQSSVQSPPQPSAPAPSEHPRPDGIPEDAVYFSGKWYKLYQEKRNWDVALEKCKNDGGRLVTIPDEATNQFVFALAGGTAVWLGATDRAVEGQWIWPDGAAMTFRNFNDDQPNDRTNKARNCLMMLKNGFWDDVHGKGLSMAYLCEWPDKPGDLAAASSTPAPLAPTAEDISSQPPRGAGIPAGPLVGTWKYNDTVQLEVRSDGTIFSNSKPAGKWTQRDKVSEYFIVLNDRSAYIATLDKYNRTLTTESRARGEKKSMERIDHGPTRNPSVPDQITSWKMERSDLETDIKSMESQLKDVKKDAADKWRKYYDAKAFGRISNGDNEAQKAEKQASLLDKSIEESRARLAEVKSKLRMN